MPLQQDRVVRFGELSGADIEGLSSIEFKNIPTDFCQLNIHIVGQAELQTTAGYQSAQDYWVDVDFQGGAAIGSFVTSDNRMDQGNWYFKTRTSGTTGAGTHLLGICNTFNVANYGADQFVMRYYIMEPGSGRSKSVQYESNFQSTSSTYSTQNYGQHRLDPQMATTNAASKSVFDTFKLTLRAQYQGNPSIPGQYSAVFGPGSRAWLEGWGGGHA
jgi:hypothetical protein